MKACKKGEGSLICGYKRNAKGEALYEKHGYPVGCSYDGKCIFQIEVKE